MNEEKIIKKYKVRKILKNIREKIFHKANELMKSNTEDKNENLQSIAETLGDFW